MNERDSEIMEQLLAPNGYLPVASPEDADLILINTCSIREKAEQKVFSLLGQLRDLKKNKPTLRIGVTGCVAQQEGRHISERMPHVDVIVGTQQIYRLPEMLARLEQQQTAREIVTDLDASFAIPPFQKLLKDHPRQDGDGSFRRFVTIMQGCNNFCSYCVVPGTRGREISRPLADIVEEVEILVAQGVKEITLLGQNVNSYGLTNDVAPSPIRFPDLLKRIARIEGLQRLRFTTSHPKDLSEELIACFGELEVLCPHFHLPVQSGSNAVLALMNRKYTVESYLEKVAALRQVRPNIALCTDIIVGFPGETDEDFAATLRLLQMVRYHGSFSFKYSDRPHTRSAEFPDKIPEAIKSERLATFQSLQDTISLERNTEYIGTTMKVMVEFSSTTEGRGRTETNHVVHFPSHGTEYQPGEIISLTISGAGKHSLKAL